MGENKHVVVALGEEYYGIPVLSVETILRDPKPVKMPRSPKMLLGVFELRGKTLAAIDLRARLDLPSREGDSNHVIVNSPVGAVSLRVDAVVGIASFDPDEIEEPNALIGQDNDGFLSGIARQADRLVALLDPEHIVPASLLKRVKAVA